MDKKRVGFIFTFLFTIPLLSKITSAQYFFDNLGTEGFIQSAVNILEPFLSALFGGEVWNDYLLFEKLLLFILFSTIIYIALTNIPTIKDRSHGLLRLIAVIVALLGIRNLDYVWLNTIFIQYQVLFIAVAGIFPFIIYWFFVNNFVGDYVVASGALRKIMWVFFAVIYFGLWITTDLEAHASIYLFTALIALAYAFFLDAKLMNWLEIQKFKKGNKHKLATAIASISDEIEDIREKINKGHFRSMSNEKLAEERIKLLEERIRKLQRRGFY